MREILKTHVYCHDWDLVTSAFWLKYPNDTQPHVKEVHTVERDIDHDNGAIQLKRLVCIEYASSFFKKNKDSKLRSDLKLINCLNTMHIC